MINMAWLWVKTQTQIPKFWPIGLLQAAAMTLLKKYSFIYKGQLISKCLFGVFKSPKKTTKFIKDFCPGL